MDLYNLCYALGGAAVGYLASDKMRIAKVASRIVDVAVDVKWFFKSEPACEPARASAVQPEAANVKWLVSTDKYKIYELNGESYITFNLSYLPKQHFEDGQIEDIRVIRHDGTSAMPSPDLTNAIIKCSGHGSAFKSGVPTLEQLKHLPGISQDELDKVKKIIVNTTALEEHIIS